MQQIVDAVQYRDQTYDFPTVLKFMEVLDGQVDNLNCWDERLRLNQLAIRAAVALRQEFDEGTIGNSVPTSRNNKPCLKIRLIL